jgi:hypothetical protein
MPLPELVPELGGYPPLTLKPITEAIQKMKDANTQKVDPTDLAARLLKQGSRKDIFRGGETSGQTGAADIFGQKNFRGPYIPSGMPPGKGAVGDKAPGALENQPNAVVEGVDNSLVRFVDCDVVPGFTYEYQIRLRMLNPNYGPPGSGAEKYVANPNDAKVQTLFGGWALLQPPLTVKSESFLYAYDPSAFRKEIEDTYKDTKTLLNRLQAKDNQAVVQQVRWLEQVRTDNSNQREPVGGWVVADTPVGRGEYIGKKTFIKLPLWSSEANQYVFREVPATVAKKEKEQPKGWLVDFSSRDILVDFDGGKTTTRLGVGRYVSDDVGTEMLILHPNGSLQVRRSAADTGDPNRKELTAIWEDWLKKVTDRPSPSSGNGESNMFERKQP